MTESSLPRANSGQPIATAPADAEELLRFLQTRDIPCPRCGYNLRALASNRCPECGGELRLTVGLTEQYLLPWLAVMVPSCLASGMGLFCSYAVLREGLPRGREEILAAPIVFFIAMIPVSLLVLWTRRQFLRLPLGAQWLLACLQIFFTAIGFIWFASQLH